MSNYIASKTGIVFAPDGEKKRSAKKVLYLSLDKECPFYTDGVNIMAYLDVLCDIIYEIGAELSFIVRANDFGDKHKLIYDFKNDRPEEFQTLIETIKREIQNLFFLETIPEEYDFTLPESYVEWLTYHSNPIYSSIGKKLANQKVTITLSPIDIFNDYVKPNLESLLKGIVTENSQLGNYTVLNTDLKDGPLKNIFSEQAPSLAYQPFNGNWIQAEIATILYWGIGCDINYIESFNLFKSSAESGYSYAQNQLGWMYQNGQGTDIDISQAFEWYKKSGENGNIYGMSNLGWCYANGKGVEVDKPKAFEWYKKAAEAGDVACMGIIAKYLFYGDGVEKDYISAHDWAVKALGGNIASDVAAELNYILGYIEFNGLCGSTDYDKASDYLLAAADGNFTKSYCLCGDAIEKIGGKKHTWGRDTYTIELYRKGANAGDEEASLKLAKLLLTTGKDSNPWEGSQLARKLANKGNHDAEYLIGKYLLQDFDPEKSDGSEIKKYLTNAISGGITDAQSSLDELNKILADYAEKCRLEEEEQARIRAQQAEEERQAKLLEEQQRQKEEEEKRRIDEEKRLAEERRKQEEQERLKKEQELNNKRIAAYNANANLIQGISLCQGNKGEYDPYKGHVLIGQAALMGFSRALAYAGFIALIAKPKSTSAFKLIERSLIPNPNTPYKLVVEYHKTKNNNNWVKFYESICQNGGIHSDCFWIAGICLCGGLLVKKDLKKGLEYLETAVRLGNIYAKTALGMMYLSGTGIVKDPNRAESLFHEAAKGGDGEAYLMLGRMEVEREAAQVEKYKREGRFYSPTYDLDYFEKAAWLGVASGMLHYADGLATIKGNKADAEKWYIKAIENSGGNKDIIRHANKQLRSIGGRTSEWIAPKPLYFYISPDGELTGFGDSPNDPNAPVVEPKEPQKKGFFSKLFGK